MSVFRPLSSALLIGLTLAAAAPAAAQWGRPMGPGWGGYGWGRSSLGSDDMSSRLNRGGPPSREGKIDSDQFLADDAQAKLGQGAVVVTSLPGSVATGSDEATYEAAIIDQLVKAGYQTEAPDPQGGQIAEIRVLRDVVVPEETKKKPVSGEVMAGVSNRGSMWGAAVAIDLSKPKKAIVSTRLEARLRDKATDQLLWEAHATVETREGSDDWTQQAIATRLAAALFEHFPRAEKVAAR